MFKSEDTISAIATSLGEGGISIIRVSGKNAIKINEFFFRGNIKLNEAKTQTVHFGNFVDTNENILDEVVVTIFREPNSYTGENLIEISCHGGIFVTKKILETILTKCRIAENGEFTKRRFLNGKIDISQAEAVADLISAKSESAYRSSLSQLKGSLSQKISEIQNKLINICSLLELELDFIEEGYEFADRNFLKQEVESTILKIESLINSYNIGKYFRNGVRVVLIGKPNVGKSSVFNAILEENRSIVTEIAGTTRDTIEAETNIGGTVFRFIDTAGIRETENIVESEGVKRSLEEIEKADLILEIFDISNKNKLKIINQNNKKLLIGNKVDLVCEKEYEKFENMCFVSAKNKTGFSDLKKKILEKTIYSNKNLTEIIAITSLRHKDLLEKAKERLKISFDGMKNNISSELISCDIRLAINFLGEIVGKFSSEDLLNNIFSKFCIGK